jgi:hypothetical protein
MTALWDFLCCALGAATVLLMNSATTLPVENPPAGAKSLVVRCRRAKDSPLVEVGIEYRAPNSETWRSVATNPSIRFSAPSDSPSGGQAFLILMEPQPGHWQFRPYLRDFPNTPPSSATVSPVTVSLDFLGAHQLISRSPPTTKMALPGDPGPTVEIHIPRPERDE